MSACITGRWSSQCLRSSSQQIAQECASCQSVLLYSIWSIQIDAHLNAHVLIDEALWHCAIRIVVSAFECLPVVHELYVLSDHSCGLQACTADVLACRHCASIDITATLQQLLLRRGCGITLQLA
jgi:hypothetical protein